MYALRAAVLAVAGVVALSATGVRIGDHPAYVRVVVDFNGRVPANQVVFDHLWTKTAALHVERPGITTWTSGRTGEGVRVALQPATQALQIGMSFAPRRFKYVSYAVVTGNRLAIDLWKSAPPAATTQTCPGLSIQTWGVKPGVVTVSGKGRGIFENTFQVVLRGTNGAVLARRTGVHAQPSWPGTWGARLHYTPSHRQVGTLEAVAFSAKDGSLACIAQVRVHLPAS